MNIGAEDTPFRQVDLEDWVPCLLSNHDVHQDNADDDGKVDDDDDLVFDDKVGKEAAPLLFNTCQPHP